MAPDLGEIRVPKGMPKNAATRGLKKAPLVGGIISKAFGWRSSAPQFVRNLGFSGSEWEVSEGATWLTLHVSSEIEPPLGFAPLISDLATRRTLNSRPELVLFTSWRERKGKPSVPPPDSLADQESWKAILKESGADAVGVAGMIPGIGTVSSIISGAVAAGLDAANKRNNESKAARIARHGGSLQADEPIDLCSPRSERPIRLDVAERSPNNTEEQRRTFMTRNIDSLLNDVRTALTSNPTIMSRQPDEIKHVVTLVEAALAWSRHTALEAFREDRVIPMEVRLLRFEGGPEQFLRPFERAGV